MNGKIITKKDIDRTKYVPIDEKDFCPPHDNRNLQSVFRYNSDYNEYRKEYEEYVEDFN